MSAGKDATVDAGLVIQEATKASLRTVAIASLIGTTIEWYDFFIFSSLTGIVFNQLFFPTGDPFVSSPPMRSRNHDSRFDRILKMKPQAFGPQAGHGVKRAIETILRELIK